MKRQGDFMEEKELILRYKNAKKALNNFSSEVPKALEMPNLSYGELKHMDEVAHKMGRLMFRSFFEPQELEIIKKASKETMMLHNNQELNENQDIYELILRYDRLNQTLDTIADSMMFKFQYSKMKDVVCEIGKNLIAGFFNPIELIKIKELKQQDTIINPVYQKQYIYQKNQW